MEMIHPLGPYVVRFFHQFLPLQKGLSPDTLESYRDTFKLLLCFVADAVGISVDDLTIEDLEAGVILAFLDHVEADRDCCAATRNIRLAAIRSFFSFVAREEPCLLLQCNQVRAIPLKRTDQPAIDYLEPDELQAFLSSVDMSSRTGVRDHAMFMVLYNTGMRVSELTNLTFSSIRLEGSPQVNILGKGRKVRACPLWSDTVAALEAYLACRQPWDPNEEKLFLNARGSPITRFGVRYVVQKYARLAAAKAPSIDSKPVSPHTFRHTTAMHLLRAGNEVNMISYWLGHADINTTHRYAKIDMEKRREMIESISPPSSEAAPSWKKPDLLNWLESLGKDSQLCAVHRPKSVPKRP